MPYTPAAAAGRTATNSFVISPRTRVHTRTYIYIFIICIILYTAETDGRTYGSFMPAQWQVYRSDFLNISNNVFSSPAPSQCTAVSTVSGETRRRQRSATKYYASVSATGCLHFVCTIRIRDALATMPVRPYIIVSSLYHVLLYAYSNTPINPTPSRIADVQEYYNINIYTLYVPYVYMCIHIRMFVCARVWSLPVCVCVCLFEYNNDRREQWPTHAPNH